MQEQNVACIEALYRRLVEIAEKRQEPPVVVACRWLEERMAAEEQAKAHA